LLTYNFVTAHLSFGRFELRPASRQLLADAQEVELGARAFDVLHALIQRRERIVTKQELLDLAWPGLVVEENNLQVQISTLRKILGQNAIVTVQGRGYQFTLEVAPVVAPPSQDSTSAATSVAVARLVAPENDPEATRSAAALTRNLVTRLGRVRGYTGQMRVLTFERDPVDDVTALGEQGRELHARYVVAGNVLRSALGYAISVQLIDATSDAQIWAYQDTLQVADIAVESSVRFENVTRRVRTAIVNAEMQRVLGQPTPVLSVEELALRALATYKKEGTLRSALEAHHLLDKALELDPDLVSALLTRVLMMDQEYGLDAKVDRSRARREIDNDTARAIKLDPANETAWGWRAIAQLYLGRWDAAAEAIDRAIELDPDNPWVLGYRALILNVTGHPADALVTIDRVRAEMDPIDAAYVALVKCQSYLLLGQFENAAAMGERSAIFARSWNVHELLVAAYANQGDWNKANAAKAELLRFAPDFTVAQARGYREPSHPEFARLAEKYIYDGLRKAWIPEQ